MFPTENVILVNTLFEFFDVISINGKKPEKFFTYDIAGNNSDKPDRKPVYWFRGQEDMTYDLQPSLYRKIKKLTDEPDKNFTVELDRMEKMLIEEFKVRNYHLLEGRPPENPLTWLTLMQHHQLSTRLLDWSDNALAALFFACGGCWQEEKKYDLFPCVWVIKPLEMLKSILFPDSDACTRTIKIKQKNVDSIPSILEFLAYKRKSKEETVLDYIDDLPLPVLAPYNSERIRSQSGVFTVYPKNGRFIKDYSDKDFKEIPLEDFSLEKIPGAEKWLCQIILCRPQTLYEDLQRVGLRKSIYFPEVPNVSQEIEERFLRPF